MFSQEKKPSHQMMPLSSSQSSVSVEHYLAQMLNCPVPSAITGISTHSQQVQPGHIFVALRGALDGHDYISEAVQHGAGLVIGEYPPALPLPVPFICVPNSRWTWAKLLSLWHNEPQKQMKLIGITGTDGKTTTANILYWLLQKAQRTTSLLSTVEANIGGERIDTGSHITTPNTGELWGFIARMRDLRQEFAVVEVTSHSLEQCRFADSVFAVGALTNLTQDHLCYHRSLEHYRAAKAKLFARSQLAILNACDPSFDYFRGHCQNQVVSYNRDSDIRNERLLHPDGQAFGQRFELQYAGAWIDIQTPLVGEHNRENILAACKVAEHFQLPATLVQEGLATFAGVPGRFQTVPNSRGLTVVVDYAHTANGFSQILRTTRSFMNPPARLIVVFGCASGRDDEKRPSMGAIAARYADILLITNEDPRQEDPGKIFAEIARGCQCEGKEEGKTYWRIDDRAKAITAAVNRFAQVGDWVLLLGKGHESSICIGEHEYPWDEFATAQKALASR